MTDHVQNPRETQRQICIFSFFPTKISNFQIVIDYMTTILPKPFESNIEMIFAITEFLKKKINISRKHRVQNRIFT